MDFSKQHFVFFITLIMTGCGFDEMISKTNKITETAFANCKCDDVKFLGYSNEGFREELDLEIIGTGDSERIEIANKINSALKNEIKDYCEIDKVKLTFINKGIKESYIFRYCKLDK